jgi:chemotaxis protein methyltransferase CheR
MAMTAGEFSYIQSLMHLHTGIVLEAGKEYLAESRLAPLAKHAGFDSLAEMIAQLRSRSANDLHMKVIEAMTTNETSFFRDFPAFQALRNTLLPDLIARRAGARRISIWCAACSSGQEPYSVAMVLHDLPGLAGWRRTILATDLSEAMLDRARAGRYSQLEINRGLPASFLVRHFERVGLEWEIGSDLREAVTFEGMNLSDPWPSLPPMDLILMRNVLIYLGPDAKARVLERARAVLADDGFLLLGGAETTHGIDDAFERVELGAGAAAFRRRAAREAAPAGR